jgi:hypothetical protein
MLNENTMEHTAPPKVTKKELEAAQEIWVGFTKFATIGVISTCVSLSFLALILL